MKRRLSKSTVSVVITVFNRYDLLPHAIESVQQQTLAGPVDLIVVDDGSSRDVRSLFEKRFPEVRWELA